MLVNGREFYAKLIAISESNDLAYLYSREAGCDAFQLGESSNLPLGHKVYTIGNPVGLKYSVTSGIISGEQEYDDVNYIQTDAAINPGNSGGPLIDSEGLLIGVNTMILSETEGIGFAIPASAVKEDMSSLQSTMIETLASPEFKHWEPGVIVVAKKSEEEKEGVSDSLKSCVEEFDNEEWGVAMDECRFAAKAGEAQAQYILGIMTYGQGGSANRRDAIDLIKKSAKQKYAEAMYDLGARHEGGDVVRRNASLALDLYEESCDLKYGPACNAVAINYTGLRKYKKAIKYLNLGQEYGDLYAQFNMAYLHENGFGVKKDKVKAYKMFEEAAMDGNNWAQYRLFWFNYKGYGTEKNYSKAFKWLIVSELQRRPGERSSDGWNSEIPTDAKFFLQKVIGKDIQARERKLAKRLIREISKNELEHEEEVLYHR